MARRTLRNAAVPSLVVGCFLAATSTPAAWAADGSAPADGSTPSPYSAAARCSTPLPAPNLPQTADAARALLWPQSKLGLSPAGVWYLSRGKGVTVAVVDTGVDRSDPAFGPETVVPGPSVVDLGETADYDCDGHGTAVAALIAGRDGGTSGFSGVAPDATILPIRQTVDPAEPGGAVRLADAIRTATAAGARVVNVSIGVTEDSPELRSAVQDALESDVVIVAAVGPGGPVPASGARRDVKYYPAALPGVLAVAAVDRDGETASFDQQTDGVRLAAPGGRIAVPAVGYPGTLTADQGAGFAAAFVSGTAALVLATRPTLHNWQVAQRLEATADKPSTDGSGNWDDSRSGASGGAKTAAPVSWGIVDPYRAVSTVLPGEVRPDPSSAPGERVVPARDAVPGHDRTAGHVALGVAGGGVVALAIPVLAAALRRGRIRGTRAGA